MERQVIDEPRAAGLPVVKRQALHERFVGAIVKTEQRDIMKKVDGVTAPVLKENGKAKQEIVVTLVTMPGSNAPAGIGDTTTVAQPGDLVRFIIRGGAFAQWIQAKNDHGPLAVGDVFEHTTEFAQAYDSNGAPKGGKLTTQSQLDAVPRATSVGVYGSLSLRQWTNADEQWVEAAVAAGTEAARQPVQESNPNIDRYNSSRYGDDEPF